MLFRSQRRVVPCVLTHIVNNCMIRLSAVAKREAPPDLAEAGHLERKHLLTLRVIEVIEEEVDVHVVLDLAHDAVEHQEAIHAQPVEDAALIQAYLGGKMRQNNIRIVPGDRVKVVVSPYDISKGRIVYRMKG